MATPPAAPRSSIPFRSVNLRNRVGYDPWLQRHHLLPRQLLLRACFGALFDHVGHDGIGYDDFRANGLLLPASERAALRIGLPLHRGPHRAYNAMVIERVGRIEASWSRQRARDPAGARGEATMRLRLLQSGLRRRLLDHRRRPLALNCRVLVSAQLDFADLDAMADTLWGVTGG